jgi:hypothetical protein
MRLHRDPGGDIFIHGYPNGWNRGAITNDWTDGCIGLTDAGIEAVWARVPTGTPVTIKP